MDETLIGTIYPILKCWMKQGQQKVIPMQTGKREYCYIAGSLNWRTQALHCRELSSIKSEAMISYFEWLLTDVYPEQIVVLVMDKRCLSP